MKALEVWNNAVKLNNELDAARCNSGYVYEELHKVLERAYNGDDYVHDNISIESDRLWRTIKDLEAVMSSVNKMQHSIQELLHVSHEEAFGGKEENSGTSEDVNDIS